MDRPGTVAEPSIAPGAPHVRDVMNLKRAINTFMVALLPVLVMALYNTGHQANLAMAELGITTQPGWHGRVIEGLGIGYDPWSIVACLWHGASHFLPVLVICGIVTHLWEELFAAARQRPRMPGGMLIALLFSLSLPPAIPLWQAALGISFGIVVGKEIFGGTGKNFLNPALVGLAFLYATYPQQLLGDGSWTVVEGFTGATSLNIVAGGGFEATHWAGTNWMQAFLGVVPGAFGETSTLACLLGAAYLIVARVASARIMAGVFFGMVAASLAFNSLVGPVVPFGDLPWYWHLTLGSFAFGMIFLATDPASAAATNAGRWIYGLLIGVLIVVIRAANVSHPDGVMFAILFGNVAAPFIDHLVIRANIKRRARRHG